MRDLLATRFGRLIAFFLLYVTEGIPQGFTAVAVATQMRRMGVSQEQVGLFIATLYLPWSWKWLMGPVVDLVKSEKLGRRRAWIFGAQLAMTGTLLLAMPIDFSSRIGLFTWIIVAHNVFAAMQDVAIDALAVDTLSESERGTANGLMFAGAYIGNALGGACVLLFVDALGLQKHFALSTFPFVASGILLVTFLVTLRLKEKKATIPAGEPLTWGQIGGELLKYGKTVGGSVFMSRRAIVILIFALLPAGSYALTLAIGTNLSVELGLTDHDIGVMTLIGTILSAAGCVAGGWISDRLGRRKSMALFVLSTALPTLFLAFWMYREGWIMPIDTQAANRPMPSISLIVVFWTTGLIFSLLHGLMYGTRAALFMDITDPRVGATQFTAYMAVLNLVIAYSAYWQGLAVKHWGYPITLTVDVIFGCLGLLLLPACGKAPTAPLPVLPTDGATPEGRGFELLNVSAERQVTQASQNHILTNCNVWSPDSKWIVYDVRSDAEGSAFDGSRIEAVNVETGEVRRLFESRDGAHCGVATFSPAEPRVAFILGPDNPTPDFNYGPDRRRGVMVRFDRPGEMEPLDARDLTPPFTPGALRGGSHVHVFSPDGKLVSFTYDDHVLATQPPEPNGSAAGSRDVPARNIGVSILNRPVQVPKAHARNHDGSAFTVLVTRTTAQPRPGSDEYGRAFEESWIGTEGYVRTDGSRQRRALAFLGNVIAQDGKPVTEVFLADLPESFDTGNIQLGEGPLQGTAQRLPYPPAGVTVRRLTRTTDRKHPGVQGPRHWVRSSPGGTAIACLMRDDAGVVQIFLVSPVGGELRQLTHNTTDIASAFTWTPDGKAIVHAMDGSVCLTDVASGKTHRLTAKSDALPLACVVSPDGKQVAYLRRVATAGSQQNQVFVVRLP